MKGWKTLAGGIGMILTGIGTIAMALSGQGDTDVQSGLTLITGGLAVIGIGHKLDKAQP
jgi:hypothetical protein